MEENVARILQMVQEGKINVQEATALISAVRGDQTASDADRADRPRRKYRRNGGPPPWFWLCLFCCRSPWFWLWFWLIYCVEAKERKEKGTSDNG